MRSSYNNLCLAGLKGMPGRRPLGKENLSLQLDAEHASSFPWLKGKSQANHPVWGTQNQNDGFFWLLLHGRSGVRVVGKLCDPPALLWGCRSPKQNAKELLTPRWIFFSMKSISCFNMPKENMENVKTMVGGSIRIRASPTVNSPVMRTGQAPGVMKFKEETSSALQTKPGDTHVLPSSSCSLKLEIVLSERDGLSISATQNVSSSLCYASIFFFFLSISFMFRFCSVGLCTSSGYKILWKLSWILALHPTRSVS